MTELPWLANAVGGFINGAVCMWFAQRSKVAGAAYLVCVLGHWLYLSVRRLP